MVKGAFSSPEPGTGKSSLVWAWCLWSATQDKKLRWIHIDRSSMATVVDFSSCSFTTCTKSHCFDAAEGLTDDVPTLVLDRATRDSKAILFTATVWLSDWLQKK